MTFGPGIIGRGDVVHGRDDDESRRKIPLRIACTMALVCNAITLCVYVIVWAGLAQEWWNEYTPNAWIGPVRAAWRQIWHVIDQTGEWLGPMFFKRLRPLALEWAICLGLLFVFDELPRILVAEGLIPYAQLDPNDEMPILLVLLFRAFRKRDADTETTIIHEIRGTVTDERGHEWRTKWVTKYPKRWRRYCRALSMEPAILRPAFSVNVATNSFFRIPRSEFSSLSDHWIVIGYAKKTSDAPNAKRYLTDKGLAFCHSWAQGDGTTPLAQETG